MEININKMVNLVTFCVLVMLSSAISYCLEVVILLFMRLLL